MPLRVIQTVINDALNINFLLQHLFYNKTPFKYTHFPSATSNEMEMSEGEGGEVAWINSLWSSLSQWEMRRR